MRRGRMGAKFSRPVARGVGRVVRSRLVSAAWTWEVGGNCSIRRATRRRHAVMGLLMLPNPHLRCLVGRWVRLGEARAVSGGCGGFGRFSRFYLGSSDGCNGGNCSIRGATRRRHAVTGLLVLPNPRLGGWWAVVGGAGVRLSEVRAGPMGLVGRCGADCRGRGAGRHKAIRAAPHGGGTARMTVRLRTSENARLKPPCNRIRR